MVESEQSCGSPSNSKGLENARYKLIKNEDKLILTDKKTLKSRVLEVEDIDYVVDDNQKLRDPNITENYFRLKDEPYTQQMVTKTADYVKEQKEADKITGKIQQDIVDQFIKKHKLTDEEIKLLADIPAEINIKKFKNRDISDIKAIINDFKVMSKDLKDKIGTDVFNYLKAYFKSYKKLADEKVDKEVYTNVLKNPKLYNNEEDQKKIKEIQDINIQKIYDAGIVHIGDINLKYLQNLINRIKKLMIIFNDPTTSKIEIDENKYSINDSTVPNCIRFQAYPHNLNIWVDGIKDRKYNTIYGLIKNQIIDELIKHKIIDDTNLKQDLNDLVNQGLDYFNTYDKFQILDELSKQDRNEQMYEFKLTLYRGSEKNEINYNRPKEYETIDAATPALRSDCITGNLNEDGKKFKKILQKLIQIIEYRIIHTFASGMASGWTDDTLTRIENIQTILNRYGFGTINPALLRVMNRKSQVSSGWTDDTLSRIENIQTILSRYGYGMKASGWTDDTLTRIEKINSTLSQYI